MLRKKKQQHFILPRLNSDFLHLPCSVFCFSSSDSWTFRKEPIALAKIDKKVIRFFHFHVLYFNVLCLFNCMMCYLYKHLNVIYASERTTK